MFTIFFEIATEDPNMKTDYWDNFVKWKALVEAKLAREDLPRGPLPFGNNTVKID